MAYLDSALATLQACIAHVGTAVQALAFFSELSLVEETEVLVGCAPLRERCSHQGML